MTVETFQYLKDAERVIGFTYDINTNHMYILKCLNNRQIVEISRNSYWLTKIEMYHREPVILLDRFKIIMK